MKICAKVNIEKLNTRLLLGPEKEITEIELNDKGGSLYQDKLIWIFNYVLNTIIQSKTKTETVVWVKFNLTINEKFVLKATHPDHPD